MTRCVNRYCAFLRNIIRSFADTLKPKKVISSINLRRSLKTFFI